MQIINDYSLIPTDKPINIMLHEHKTATGLHIGYKEQLEAMVDPNCYLVLDMIQFLDLIELWYGNTTFQNVVPRVSEAAFSASFQAADYVVKVPAANPYFDNPIAKQKALDNLQYVNANCIFQFGYGQYMVAAVLTCFELYNFTPAKTNNQWHCGERSYYYKQMLNDKLGINMELIDIQRDNNGMELLDHFDTFSPAKKAEIMKIINGNPADTTTIENTVTYEADGLRMTETLYNLYQAQVKLIETEPI